MDAQDAITLVADVQAVLVVEQPVMVHAQDVVIHV